MPRARRRTALPNLRTTTLGILGVGTIGRRIASIARDGFGMKVLGTSRRKGSLPAGIEEVSLARPVRPQRCNRGVLRADRRDPRAWSAAS